MNKIYGADAEEVCVGACYQDSPPFSHHYWSEWALDLMAEGFTLVGGDNHIIYSREDNKVIRINNVKGSRHIYVLVDEYDGMGRQLGVWPD